MARRKGLKQWDEITVDGWMELIGNTTVMSKLMIQIFSRLYHSPDYMDNAKNIADALHMEYRALNAGVGWAGNKIKEMYEAGKLSTYHSYEKISYQGNDHGDSQEFTLQETPKIETLRSPWEYVFDGAEGDGGIYFWILKPEAVKAYREIIEADLGHTETIRQILGEDETAFGMEGNLFSENPETTVEKIRHLMDKEEEFQRKSLPAHPCCMVCGIERMSLLHAVPYGMKGKEQKGLLFCPTHGALFAAHLISFNNRGTLLISKKLQEKDKKALGITEGMVAKDSFSHRRMSTHRKIFDQEERKLK